MNEIEKIEERLEEMNLTEAIMKTTKELTRWELAFAELAELTGASAELLMQLKAKYKLE
nr:MAG TPA: hypothetical protein [Caudoviricetes sp.]